MKRKLSAVAGLLVLAISFGSWSHPAEAAPQVVNSGNGLKIAPVRRDLTIEKGKSQTDTIFLENVTNKPATVHGIVNDFVPSDGEDGIAKIILDEKQSAPGNSFKTLVPTKLPEMTLQPKQRKEIKVTINVPANAASGGYYGVVRFAPIGSDLSQNVSLTASVGSLYLVRVPGGITEKLSLTDFGVQHNNKKGRLFQNGAVSVVSKFKNDGNIHVQPFGRVTLKNMRGKVLETIEINNLEPRANVLPSSTRKFTTKLTKVKQIGRYSVEGNFGYGENGQLLMAKATFYVVPYWLIGGAVILLLLLVFGLPIAIRRYNRRIIARASRSNRRR